MNINDIKGHKVLNMIDHTTRYSVVANILNKENVSIVKCIFKY